MLTGLELAPVFELKFFLGLIVYVGLIVYGLTEIRENRSHREWDL